MADFRFARADDIPVLRRIWFASFPEDTVEDCTLFLDTVNLSEECMVACVDGEPVSMAFFLPAVFRSNGKEVPTRYLYTASTLPAYRGNGYFSYLLKKSLCVLKGQGIAACFLHPALPSLVKYYERFGFRPFCYSRTESGAAQVRDVPLSHAADFIRVRQSLLPPQRVDWDDRFLRFAATYATPYCVGENGYALCEKRGDTLRILELLGAPPTVCGALAARLGCTTYTVCLPAESGECFGMAVPLQGDETEYNALYMGLAFD